MTHEARKATKEQVRKASEESMKENEELLKRLENDELIFVKKMKQSIGIVSDEDEILSVSDTVVPNRGLDDINTSRNVTPFSVNVYPDHGTPNKIRSEPLIIEE